MKYYNKKLPLLNELLKSDDEFIIHLTSLEFAKDMETYLLNFRDQSIYWYTDRHRKLGTRYGESSLKEKINKPYPFYFRINKAGLVIYLTTISGRGISYINHIINENGHEKICSSPKISLLRYECKLQNNNYKPNTLLCNTDDKFMEVKNAMDAIFMEN